MSQQTYGAQFSPDTTISNAKRLSHRSSGQILIGSGSYLEEESVNLVRYKFEPAPAPPLMTISDSYD